MARMLALSCIPTEYRTFTSNLLPISTYNRTYIKSTHFDRTLQSMLTIYRHSAIMTLFLGNEQELKTYFDLR